MPYGQFTGYQSIDTPEAAAAGGAYSFNTTSGQPITIVGQQGAELASRVDASNAAQANQSVAPVSPSSEVNQSVTQPVRMGTTVTSPDQISPALQQSIAEDEAAQNAKHPTVIASTKSGGVIYQNEKGDTLVNEPGHGGSKGGLALKSEEIKGGYDPNKAYLDETAANNADIQKGRDIAFAAATKQSAMDQASLQANQAAQANAEAEAKNRQWQIDQQVAEKNTKYENALSDYSNSKVDPGRLTRGNWGLNIARLLGTIASSLPTRAGQSPIRNYAGEMVDRQIDQDIDAQKAEIAVKKDSANNALTDLTRKLGSQQLAVEALRGIRQNQAATAMQQDAMQTKDAQLSADYLTGSAEMRQKAADHKENYLRMAHGDITQHIQNVAATSAVRAHDRLLTPEEQHQILLNKKLGADTGAVEAKTANAGGGGKLSSAQKSTAEDLDSSILNLRRARSDWESSGKPGVFTTGALATKPSMDQTSRANALAPLIAKSLGGKGTGGMVAKQFKEDATSASSDKIEAAYNAAEQALLDKRAQIAAHPGAAPAAEPAASEEEPPPE